MYGKVFKTIYEGSLYGQFEATVTFQALIVLADKDGVVDMTPQAIIGTTGYPPEVVNKGLAELQQPDPASRSTQEEGKRIILLDPEGRDWGWQIVNYLHYRDKGGSLEQRRQKDAERQRRRREKLSRDSNDTSQDGHSESAHTDTDTDTDIKPYTSSSDDAGPAKAVPCPHQKIISLYHEHCPDLPKVRTWEGDRQVNLRNRFAKRNNIEWWEWFFKIIHTLDFYNGREEGKNWKASLPWIVKQTNFQKLVDLAYERTEETTT